MPKLPVPEVHPAGASPTSPPGQPAPANLPRQPGCGAATWDPIYDYLWQLRAERDAATSLREMGALCAAIDRETARVGRLRDHRRADHESGGLPGDFPEAAAA
ncbi:MAG TPA: hypothetical protein VNF73_16970 [Candidatus Saccharimonadales bacterium]|nr:hypothetical protein [Candidatus Saccharimonadales bacterium]